ncbi:hypothetical protein ACQ4PT_010260 [Festuca glaucescens]
MTPLIPRNPTMPTKKTHVLTRFWDKRSTVTIKVFQGDRSETKHCRLLGQLDLCDIPTASIWNWGRRDIEVTMEADEYGKLRVEATDKRSGKSESAIIYHGGRLSPEAIDRMVREGEAWQARGELEAYMRSVTDGVDGKMELEVEEEEKLEEAVSKAREWLDINPVAEKENYEENLGELAEVCDPVVSAVHQRQLPGVSINRANKITMSCAAALLLCLLLAGSINLTASLFDPTPRRAKNSDVIGIDLGTTYSRVAVYRNGRVEIVPDEQGNRATPSQVAFTDGGNRFVGEDAKDQHAASTIYGAAKRLLGRRFSDADVQREVELLPYAVVDEEGRPQVRVPAGDGGEVLVLSPEEIAADVLAKLKGTAEAFLGRNVTKALITVPAYYKDAQRQATKVAGVIAGLEVLRILNDPFAAAMAYGLLDKRYDKKTLVFDLGGGTFDVTVILVEDVIFEVLSTSGNSHLGCQDFDQHLTDHFVEVIKQKHGRDITGDSRALQRLRRECERAKRALSDQLQAHVEIEALFDGVQFEELNEDLFLKAMAQVEKAVADAELDKREIDEIILVGGSTRIPKVQQLVRDYFDGKEPLSGINPDEAMAYGAAVQGSYLTRYDHEEPQMNQIAKTFGRPKVIDGPSLANKGPLRVKVDCRDPKKLRGRIEEDPILGEECQNPHTYPLAAGAVEDIDDDDISTDSSSLVKDYPAKSPVGQDVSSVSTLVQLGGQQERPVNPGRELPPWNSAKMKALAMISDPCEELQDEDDAKCTPEDEVFDQAYEKVHVENDMHDDEDECDAFTGEQWCFSKRKGGKRCKTLPMQNVRKSSRVVEDGVSMTEKASMLVASKNLEESGTAFNSAFAVLNTVSPEYLEKIALDSKVSFNPALGSNIHQITLLQASELA